MEQLLSKDITDCFPQVCTILSEALGSSWKTGITTPFFMFLENGCTNHLPQSSSNSIEKWCNFLLYEMGNINATAMEKQQAERIFNEGNKNIEIFRKYCLLFQMECTVEEACLYCENKNSEKPGKLGRRRR